MKYLNLYFHNKFSNFKVHTSFWVNSVSDLPSICWTFGLWIDPFFESLWFQNSSSFGGFFIVWGNPRPNDLLFYCLLDGLFHWAFENGLWFSRPLALSPKRIVKSLPWQVKMIFSLDNYYKILPIIVIFQNIKERVSPFYPNAVFAVFFKVIFLDRFAFSILGSFFAPFQINWTNFGDLIVLLNIS